MIENTIRNCENCKKENVCKYVSDFYEIEEQKNKIDVIKFHKSAPIKIIVKCDEWENKSYLNSVLR